MEFGAHTALARTYLAALLARICYNPMATEDC